jgi:hypothetical protein
VKLDPHIVLGIEDPPVEGMTLTALCGRELWHAGFVWEPEPLNKISDLNSRRVCSRCLKAIPGSEEFVKARYVAGALDGEYLLPRNERETDG